MTWIEQQHKRRSVLALAGACALAPAALAATQAASWPTRSVRILVGFPPGSTPDIAARVLAEALARVWSQPVVVENRAGASGNIAADAVAKSGEDHTLGVLINGNLTTARRLNPRLAFDPARDFSLLSLLATAPLVLVGAVGEPTGAAFLAAAQQAGSRWSYGSVGVGSVSHLGMELIKRRAAFTAVHVPYGGNPAVLNALIAGEIRAALVPPGLALPPVRAGRVQAIGLTGGRSVLAPDVAPLADIGLRADELEVWTALVGPAGLARAAQQRLAQDVPQVLRQPEVRQRLFSAGWQMQGTSPDGLRLRVQQEARTLGDIIDSLGLRAE